MRHRYDWQVRPAHSTLSEQEESRLFPRREWTLAWLRDFRPDRQRMADLRKLLTGSGYLPVHTLRDGALLNALASEIVWGRLQLVREVHKPIPLTPASEGEPDWAPTPARPAPRQQEIVEEQTFPLSADLAAIADAQKEAARLGVPFCEECARRALAEALA
ncbi:MAG TPA: hypothetical protein VMH28_04845 [Candidatus Acidoferrales bacterium]|nr:hypothetical protein [Candidatus Acidoferrales bacterium]